MVHYIFGFLKNSLKHSKEIETAKNGKISQAGPTFKVVPTPVRRSEVAKPSAKPVLEGPTIKVEAPPKEAEKPNSTPEIPEQEPQKDSEIARKARFFKNRFFSDRKTSIRKFQFWKPMTISVDISKTNLLRRLQFDPFQAKLRNAARSHIMRWIKPHPKQPVKDAPEWLQNEWRTGNKNEIADLLAHCNFKRDLARFGCKSIFIGSEIPIVSSMTFRFFRRSPGENAGRVSQQAHHLHQKEAEDWAHQRRRMAQWIGASGSQMGQVRVSSHYPQKMFYRLSI